MNAVTRLAVGSIRSHKLRSAAIYAAIILTCVLFMTVVSIIFNIFGGALLMLMLNSGYDFHASITCPYGTPADKVLKAVSNDDSVREASIIAEYGAYDTDQGVSGCRIKAVDSYKACGHMFIKFTEGEFPSEGSVALRRDKFPDAETGEKISFNKTTPVYGTGGVVESIHTELGEFTITGFFECGAADGVCTDALIFYKPSSDTGTLSVTSVKISFFNIVNLNGKLENVVSEIYKIPGLENVKARISDAYSFSRSNSLNAASVSFTLFSIFVVFFSAFLLIYNIYSIALTQDIRAFGLLGVIGTTYKQLRSLIRRQAMIYYVVSAPFGLAAGYIIGWRLLAPTFMQMSGSGVNYNLHGFSTWVLIPTVLLTLFTLFFSALRPLRRISKLTPVETVNAGKKEKSAKSRKPVGINPFILAFISAIRGRKRLLISVLSAALSVTLFVLISTLSGIITDFGLRSMPIPDIILSPSITTTAMYPDGQVQTNTGRAAMSDKQAVIGKTLYDKIRSINGFRYVYTVRCAPVDIDADEDIKAVADQILAEFGEESEYLNFLTAIKSAAEGKIKTLFISIPDELCKYIVMDNNESQTAEKLYNGKELYDGKHIIAANTYGFALIDESNQLRSKTFSFYEEGDIISSAELNGEYAVIRSDLNVWGDTFRNIIGNVYCDAYIQPLILPQSVFEREFDDIDIYAVLCSGNDDGIFGSLKKTDSENKLSAEVKTAVDSYLEEKSAESTGSTMTYGVAVAGRYTELSELRIQLNALELVGYSLAALIFFIGVLNMVNSSLSTVTEHRREYALLEAVGMTGRQMKLMLLTEGFICGVLAAIFVLMIGVPVVSTFIRAATGIDTNVDIIPAAVMLALLFVISAITSFAAYHMIKRASVTERLRTE